MKAKKGFSLLEVTVAMIAMGMTVVALLNILQWSNSNYKSISMGWKERAMFTDVRTWLRDQILDKNNADITLEKLNESVKCPDGYHYKELTVSKHDENTFFVKLGIFEDRNNNGKADSDEVSNRLFCFRRRTV